ncbi:MAG: NPCBM/NEW2 domain-containing protein [Candidatus Altiarchaeota archaeon]
MNKLEVLLVLTALLVGFHVRLLFMGHPGHTIDLAANARGSDTMAAHGLFAIFKEYPNMVMPPLWQVFLWASTMLHRLSFAGTISNFYLKLPGVLADLAVALIIYVIVRRKASLKTAYASMLVFLLNPGIVYNSAYWGKWDVLPMVFVVAALYFLSVKRPLISWALLALGVMVKLQILIYYPLFAFVTYRKYDIKKTLACALASAVTVAVVSAPFIIGSGLGDMIEKGWTKPSESFPLATVNAYNLWYTVNYLKGHKLTDLNWYYGIRDYEVLSLGLTYKTAGLILFTLSYLAVIYYVHRKKERASLYYAAASIAFFSFMLPTRVHERYMLYALPLLAVIAFKDKRFALFYAVLSITFFLNIQHVLATQYGYWGYDLYSVLSYEELALSRINLLVMACMLSVLVGLDGKASKSRRIKRYAPYAVTALVLSCFILFYQANSCPRAAGATYLDEIPYASARQGYGILGRGASVDRNPLTVNGVYYCRGLGTHAYSEIIYDTSELGGSRFLAWIGVDDESTQAGKVVFKVYGDEKLLFESASIDYTMPAARVDVAVASVNTLKLVVESDGSEISDHADWADAKIVEEEFTENTAKPTWPKSVSLFFSRFAVFLALILIADLTQSILRLRLNIKRALLVAALLALFIIQCGLSMSQKNLTYDEPGHIGAGYADLKYGEFRFGGLSSMEHPPLVRSASAIPLYLLGDVWNMDGGVLKSGASHFTLGNTLVYGNSARTEDVIFLSRTAIVFLSCLLALYVFLWSERLFGKDAGFLALFLYVFSPNILAHSRLVTTDIGGTLFIFAAMYYLWNWSKDDSNLNLLLAGLAVGLAFTSKISGIILVPVTLVLAAAYAGKDAKKTCLITSRLAAAAVIALLVVSAAYGFQGMFRPLKSIPVKSSAMTAVRTTPLAYIPMPLPATYVEGMDYGMWHSEEGHTSYFMGEVSNKGSWYYYPFMFLIKVPIAMLALITLAAITLRKRRDLIFLALPALVLLILLARGNANIGLRHILPAFPFIYVYVAGIYGKTNKKVLIGLCVLYLYASLSIYPHYLAYFNELAGGPDGGYRYSVISDLDWGQDMLGLSEYLKKNNIELTYYSKYGTADASYYGLEYEPLPCAKTHGLIAIHAANLMRDEKCNEWLRDYEPFDKIGYSVFLYNVSE